MSGVYPGEKEAIPLALHNREGAEYWLGFDNFYVITRYNNSVYYAMAVYQLSRELRKQTRRPSRRRRPLAGRIGFTTPPG